MKEESINKLTLAILVLTLVVAIVNATSLSSLGSNGATVTGAAINSVLPTGVPEIYGEELGISFDSVSASNPQLADQTIRTMGMLDVNIELDDAQKERYINALYTLNDGISCEYCCGARSIIFENGEAACGCAHSYAMRGIAKYLITEHGDEYTDEEIQAELAKWKVLYFPTQMTAKAQALEDQGIEATYNNIGSNTYRGIEQGKASGGMVGGC